MTVNQEVTALLPVCRLFGIDQKRYSFSWASLLPPNHQEVFALRRRIPESESSYLSVVTVCGGKGGRNRCLWSEIGTITELVRIPNSFRSHGKILRGRRWMLKYGQQYVDKGAEYYERRNRQQQIEFLRKKAARLGLQLAPVHPW